MGFILPPGAGTMEVIDKLNDAFAKNARNTSNHRSELTSGNLVSFANRHGLLPTGPYRGKWNKWLRWLEHFHPNEAARIRQVLHDNLNPLQLVRTYCNWIEDPNIDAPRIDVFRGVDSDGQNFTILTVLTKTVDRLPDPPGGTSDPKADIGR